MDSVYFFVESVHMFVPVIAVVSCILIIFCCGFRTSQQPSDEYLDKIKTLEDFSRKKKSKEKPKAKSSQSSQSASNKQSADESELKQRPTEARKPPQSKPTASETAAEPVAPAAEGSWIEVTAKKTKKISTKPSRNQESAEEFPSSPGSPIKIKADSPQKPSPRVARPQEKQVKTGPIRVEISHAADTTATSSPRSVGRSDETSSVASHKSFSSSLPEESASSASTTASSSKTFEKISALDQTPLEELEVEADDFILVSANSQDQSGKDNESPKKNRKKKAKVADVDLQPFMQAEKLPEPLEESTLGQAEIPSTSAAEDDVHPATNSDGPEETEAGEDGVPKKRKSKKKKEKKPKGKAGGEGVEAKEAEDSDEGELPVASEVPLESDGFVEAQKPRRRPRRDV